MESNSTFQSYHDKSMERIDFNSINLLIVGVGGIGTEILRYASLQKFKSIHIIDMDRIVLSNISRQQLYSSKDVGKPKVEVAAANISNEVDGTKIIPHFRSIQDMGMEFYSQFDVIMCGLDSYESRRWINAAIFQQKPEIFHDRPYWKPILLDGASEGLAGSVRVILPRITACYECTLGLEVEPKRYPICTVTSTPRQPEHCVENALFVQWPKNKPDMEYNNNDPEHVCWVLEESMNVASKYDIKGLTPRKARNVLLSIVPSTIFTNSLVASLMIRKLYMMLHGYEIIPSHNLITYTAMKSVVIHKHHIEKLNDCPLCGIDIIELHVNPNITLKDLMKVISEDSRIKMTNISIRSTSRTIYMPSPKSIRNATLKNLSISISNLISNGSLIYVTGSGCCHTIKICLKFI